MRTDQIYPAARYCDWCLSGIAPRAEDQHRLVAFGDDGECPRHGGRPEGVSGAVLMGLLAVRAQEETTS